MRVLKLDFFLIKGERNILESLLGTVEQHISAQGVRHTFDNYIKIMIFDNFASYFI